VRRVCAHRPSLLNSSGQYKREARGTIVGIARTDGSWP
jgi:hypothetical protein